MSGRSFWRRAICLLAAASLFTCQANAVSTSAASAVLMEQRSGRVLYEQNGDEERLIASITKIMTAVVALEYGRMQQEYTVTAQDMAEGSSMYLKPGDVLRLEELLYGLMLVSGNDAALAVAHCVAGETEAFVALMNQKAEELGMTHSHFANPNGLDAEGHYASARDMAVRHGPDGPRPGEPGLLPHCLYGLHHHRGPISGQPQQAAAAVRGVHRG